jgi:Terminase large subunit, T4likevirus-type, N-terminal
MIRTIPTQSRSELLSEFICSVDPVAFAQSLGIACDPWQIKALRSPHKRVQILASRQSGKSMTCALYALWFAINHPKATVLIISPSLRQSQLMMRTILDFYNELNIPSEVESALSLRIATTKSVIVALPGIEKTIRGYRADCIIFDESALIDDDTYRAVRPMAAVSDAKIFAIGTPHGKRGWYYRLWEESDEFYKIKVTASDCPRLASRPEYLAQERRTLGQFWYEQEFECVFHQAEASIFRLELIEASIGDFEELDLDLDDDVADSDDLHDSQNSQDTPPLADSSHELHLEDFDNLDFARGR